MKFRGFGYSVIGGRELNQDSFLVNDDKRLYAVADGIGGGMKGEVASQMAVTGLDELSTGNEVELSGVMHSLQKKIYQQAIQEFGEPIMGTTLTVVRGDEGEAQVCHVGDSRCYLYSQGELKQLTNDHEFFDERIQGTVLSSYLGLPEEIHALEVSEQRVGLSAGDRILLCSDGLYRQVEESRIAQLVTDNLTESQALTQLLCEEASRKEYSDNVTVVIVEVHGVDKTGPA